MFCTREAIKAMKQSGGGDIVNISTQSVPQPQPMMIAYAAAKGGLETFARGLRNELRGQNIRVSTIQIGGVAGTVVESPPEKRVRFVEALANAGLDRAFVFPGTQPAQIAEIITHVITSPRDTVFEDIVVRGF